MKRRRETLDALQQRVIQKHRENVDHRGEGQEAGYWESDTRPEVRQALQRSKQGLYGVCVDCEKQIPIARLRAKPEAIRCIGCQSVYELRAMSA